MYKVISNMKQANINGDQLIVVGQFFALNDTQGCRLKTAYAGQENQQWLDEAFSENTQEDFAELAKHPDPNVRLLVVRNLEQLDELSSDDDPMVKSRAQFTKDIIADSNPIAIERDCENNWARA